MVTPAPSRQSRSGASSVVAVNTVLPAAAAALQMSGAAPPRGTMAADTPPRARNTLAIEASSWPGVGLSPARTRATNAGRATALPAATPTVSGGGGKVAANTAWSEGGTAMSGAPTEPGTVAVGGDPPARDPVEPVADAVSVPGTTRTWRGRPNSTTRMVSVMARAAVHRCPGVMAS